MLSQDAIRGQPWTLREIVRVGTSLAISVLVVVLLTSGNPRAEAQTPEQCRLIPANPPGFRPLAFVPNVIKDKRFKNRRPRLSLVVGEDGTVRNVKVVKGTGAPTVDAALVKSIKAWRFKPQAGCVIESALVVTIDITSSE